MELPVIELREKFSDFRWGACYFYWKWKRWDDGWRIRRFSCANERGMWRIAVEDDGKKSEALLRAN